MKNKINESQFFLSTSQNLLEACRVRSAHHCEPKFDGLLFQFLLFWCAERTLQIFLEPAKKARL